MRQAAADEASSGNAAADGIVAAGWLGKGCGAHSVRALRQLHRATQVGKQGRESHSICYNPTALEGYNTQSRRVIEGRVCPSIDLVDNTCFVCASFFIGLFC